MDVNFTLFTKLCLRQPVTPRGAGVPPFRLCFSLIHSLPHLLLFITFPIFLFSFTLLIFFYCPSDPFLPESSHSVSRREVVGGDRTWVRLFDL